MRPLPGSSGSKQARSDPGIEGGRLSDEQIVGHERSEIGVTVERLETVRGFRG
jgi:hypothetical protein